MRTRNWINLIAVMLVGCLGVIIGCHMSPQSIQAQSAATVTDKDNPELARLYQEDQSDRQPKDGKPIDWKVVDPRDKVRESG